MAADIARASILFAIFARAYKVFGDDNDDWMLIKDLLKMGPEATEEAFDCLLKDHGLRLDGHLLSITETTEPRTRSTDDSPSSHPASSAGPDEQSYIGKRPPDAMVLMLAWTHLLSNIDLDFKKLGETFGVSESEA
ncbi:hypothetical protein Z517_09208 [Fonsecaea pedrosoi CBS 271.37]|uniref:Uncharacterized protein n=1 Tax=Fonsecaea pedrosoi CBS 271.37 TaxID=1442368 RepID=A0A0D2GWM5_9EURO|nr:uncharacterized protein Z517_09208 [Fonsecaea pedrosoi CBS 271.37]KIW76764.1 hypothetical protein Z517_09208 [Fonsecaea pedrosoi CBS 271.37]